MQNQKIRCKKQRYQTTASILFTCLIASCGSGNLSESDIQSLEQENTSTPELGQAVAAVSDLNQGISVAQAASSGSQASVDLQEPSAPVQSATETEGETVTEQRPSVAVEEEPSEAPQEESDVPTVEEPSSTDSTNSQDTETETAAEVLNPEGEIDTDAEMPIETQEPAETSIETESVSDVTDNSDEEVPTLIVGSEETTTTDFFPDNVIGSTIGSISKILNKLEVSTAQLNVQTTPIAAGGGYVYTANIEHGPDGDANGINLKTVVRQGRMDDNGNWIWTSFVVEDRTVHDEYHTSPSVAVDRHGFVHVTYNMHNIPWQYKRTVRPHDITEWEFLGQEVTTAQLRELKFENRVSYPTLGTAEIPGNQITYPAFFYDNNNDIYLSYRFAAKPAQRFANRAFSGALAEYDVDLRRWTSIGEEVINSSDDFRFDEDSSNTATALASQQGWTAYHPRINFGPNNEIGIFHFYRNGIAGTQLTRPCAYRETASGGFETYDGSPITLPVTTADCGNMGFSDSQQFYSTGNVAGDSKGMPSVLLSPVGEPRVIMTYSESENKWVSEKSPGNSIEIFYDRDDNLWAASHRFTLYRRLANETEWQTVFKDDTAKDCHPKVRLNANRTVAYIHTHACDSKSVSIYGLQLVTPEN